MKLPVFLKGLDTATQIAALQPAVYAGKISAQQAKTIASFLVAQADKKVGAQTYGTTDQVMTAKPLPATSPLFAMKAAAPGDSMSIQDEQLLAGVIDPQNWMAIAQSPEILRPDVAARFIDILAAYVPPEEAGHVAQVAYNELKFSALRSLAGNEALFNANWKVATQAATWLFTQNPDACDATTRSPGELTALAESYFIPAGPGAEAVASNPALPEQAQLYLLHNIDKAGGSANEYAARQSKKCLAANPAITEKVAKLIIWDVKGYAPSDARPNLDSEILAVLGKNPGAGAQAAINGDPVRPKDSSGAPVPT